MADMLSETYAAFWETGMSEERSRAAAEETAGGATRLVRLEVTLSLGRGGIVALLLGVATPVITISQEAQLPGAFEHTGAILDPTRVSPYSSSPGAAGPTHA